MRAVLVLVVASAACQSSDVSRELGARCDKSSECDDRCLPPDGDYPGGLCTVVCNASGDCPGDSACADRDGGVCLYTCAKDPDCAFLGDGWTCHDEDERGMAGDKVMVCRGG